MYDLPLDIRKYFLDADTIDAIYAQDKILLPQLDVNEIEIWHIHNGYALFQDITDPKHSAIARYVGNGYWSSIAKRKALKFENILPKDLYQTVLFDSLANPDILLSVVVGSAGTGKTTIALAYALNQYLQNKKNIILVKPTVMVGKGNAFGPVPGDISDKYAPYLTSYELVIRKVLGPHSKTFIDQLKANEHLQFFPLELVRGCTFENCTLILDEAQNIDWHEMNTLVSRMGEGSKMIILGDLNQVDTGIHCSKTGLYKMLKAAPFQDSSISSSIELSVQYRSPITQLVTSINAWISEHG